MDLEMSGLRIESHISPDEAWSDAEQQITPKRLQEVLSSLVIRQTAIQDNDLKDKLNVLRTKIDIIDEEIINQLAKRMEIVSKIGSHKSNNNVTILQAKRWEKIILNRKEVARELGISEEFIEKILKTIHEESINLQTNILNSKKKL